MVPFLIVFGLIVLGAVIVAIAVDKPWRDAPRPRSGVHRRPRPEVMDRATTEPGARP